MTNPNLARPTLGGLLVRADSVTSEVAHRFGGALPDEVKADLVKVSIDCRALAAEHRDELAARVAQAWSGERYIGELTADEWTRWYRVVDAIYGGPDA